MFSIRHRMEMFSLIFLGTALSLFVLGQRNKLDKRVFSAVIPTQTVTLPIDPVQTTIMNSPDGVETLTMKKQQIKGSVKYSFYTSAPDAPEQVIFNKELENSHNLLIPYNTWSPDNEYIFLKESTPTLNNYYVFLASGKPVSDSDRYVNIQELFSQKLPDYKIIDVTGWAGPTLIIVNAIANSDNQNISFWFDVTNHSFTQLGTYFN